MELDQLRPAQLHRFDGGDGAGGTPGTMAAPEDAPAQTRPEAPQAEQAPEPEAAAQTDCAQADARRAEYEALCAQYSDLDEARLHAATREADRRAQHSRRQLAALDAALAPLYAAHGLKAGDVDGLARAVSGDRHTAEREAAAAGLTYEQYQRVRETRENDAREKAARQRAAQERAATQQMDAWAREASDMRQTYPTFDLMEELGNPLFVSLMTARDPKARLGLRAAYEACHHEALCRQAAATAARRAEVRLTQSIRAGSHRPAESAAGGAAGAHTGRVDVAKLTRAEREALERRAMRGEHITFRGN